MQTQARLHEEIVVPKESACTTLTKVDEKGDFQKRQFVAANRALGGSDGFTLVVLKKNAAVLRNFNSWLGEAGDVLVCALSSHGAFASQEYVGLFNAMAGGKAEMIVIDTVKKKLSPQEADQVARFVTSPAGKKYTAEVPGLMKEYADLVEKLNKEQQHWIRRELADVQLSANAIDQPEVLPPN